MKETIASLEREFSLIHAESCELLNHIAPELLYEKVSGSNSDSQSSFGEEILRSAAAVEQTFGGITTNLWDDPFEWTLPETLKTPASVAFYLNEVEATRERGFSLFSSDEELRKEISVPSGEMKSLSSLLVETLERAAHHQGRAFATFRLFSDARLPRI